MKLKISILLAVFGLFDGAHSQTLPSRYHTYAEGIAELAALEELHPEICRLDSVGFSNRDSVTVYQFKISDNAQTDDDEPAIFFNGGVHADEVLGPEVVLNFCQDIVGRYANGDTAARRYIENYEIFVIPFINPEGHIVVENGDTAWRKNKSDNNNNGQFDFHDGVDCNRNYDFGWEIDTGPEGVTPESLEYKGTAPFTESETRALRDLGIKYKPIIAVDYHSPSYGRSEVVYYCWYWFSTDGGHGMAPDEVSMFHIGSDFAGSIVDDHGDSTYEARRALVNKGDFKTYFYGNFGTAAMVCEISDTTIQDTSLVGPICQRHLAGMYYLLRRAGYARLTGVVTDSITGLPLEAEVVVSQATGPDINPRYARPSTGRYDRLIDPGTYTLVFQKAGYTSKTVNNVVVTNSGPTTTDVRLSPTNPPPPAIPVLLSPENGYISHQAFLSFDWSDSPGANRYAIQVAPDSLFGFPVIYDSSLLFSEYRNIDSLANGDYFWRARAGNNFGWSEFSGARSFAVQADTGLMYIVGDVNHSGAVNGIDVIYLVNYFKGGPPPPLEIQGFYPEADVNGNCVVNGIDVIYLVNFFKGGAPPVDGECL